MKASYLYFSGIIKLYFKFRLQHFLLKVTLNNILKFFKRLLSRTVELASLTSSYKQLHKLKIMQVWYVENN